MKKVIVISALCSIALFYSPPIQHAILYTDWDTSSFSSSFSSLGEFFMWVEIIAWGDFAEFLCWIGDVFAIGK